MSCRVLSGKDCIITCKFGPRKHPVTGAYSNHNGVDVVGAGYTLALITAHTGGVVEYAGYNSTLGYHVNVRLSNGDMMQYCHMTKALQVTTGDTVQQGQVLGTMGSTGLSTGAHLHFGIKRGGAWIDPEPYLYKDYLEETMTGKEIYDALSEYMASQELPTNWDAKDEFEEAVAAGITDGSNPCGLIPRYQAAIMALRSQKGKTE